MVWMSQVDSTHDLVFCGKFNCSTLTDHHDSGILSSPGTPYSLSKRVDAIAWQLNLGKGYSFHIIRGNPLTEANRQNEQSERR
jgi:hypothetical protein